MGGSSAVVLGIDTSGAAAGAALLRGDRVLASLSATGPHSAGLLPMVRSLLSASEVAPADLEVVGVARGPGSYTGLRVGVVTAKTLGWATGATVVGVPTLEVMAALAPAEAGRVHVALRAYKRRVLSAWFRRGDDGVLRQEGEAELLQAEEVPAGDGSSLLVTDTADLLGEVRGHSGRRDILGPVAEEVARFARDRVASGGEDESYALAPVYLRPPSITVGRGHRR